MEHLRRILDKVNIVAGKKFNDIAGVVVCSYRQFMKNVTPPDGQFCKYHNSIDIHRTVVASNKVRDLYLKSYIAGDISTYVIQRDERILCMIKFPRGNFEYLVSMALRYKNYRAVNMLLKTHNFTLCDIHCIYLTFETFQNSPICHDFISVNDVQYFKFAEHLRRFAYFIDKCLEYNLRAFKKRDKLFVKNYAQISIPMYKDNMQLEPDFRFDKH